MAVTWTPFADGYSLSLLRTAFNTFNSAVKVNIDNIETDITALDSSKISVADTGLVFVTGASSTPVSLTTAYQKVIMGTTLSVNSANGHITGDLVLGTITINTTGVYKFVFSGSMTANNGSIVTFNYNLNGVSMISTPPEFVGKGASPVGIENHFVVSLTAGAVIYIEAKADSAISMTPTSSALMIEKTHF